MQAATFEHLWSTQFSGSSVSMRMASLHFMTTGIHTLGKLWLFGYPLLCVWIGFACIISQALFPSWLFKNNYFLKKCFNTLNPISATHMCIDVGSYTRGQESTSVDTPKEKQLFLTQQPSTASNTLAKGGASVGPFCSILGHLTGLIWYKPYAGYHSCYDFMCTPVMSGPGTAF